MMALYIVLLGVFLAVILLCVLLSVHMAIEVEADYDLSLIHISEPTRH